MRNGCCLFMGGVIFESVSKVFRAQGAFFGLFRGGQRENKHALRNVSLYAQPGRVLVLLGPNGSGKTTTLKLISTVLLPDKGRVFVESADTKTNSSHARRQVGFAVANERSFFPRLSARENLDFFAALEEVPHEQRKKQVRKVLSLTGLSSEADTLVMKFSSGMYQRLAIARALIKDPAVLLLDEPTRSLDPAATAKFWELVRGLSGQEKTILLATHNFAEATSAGDSVVVLNRGVIAGQTEIRHQSAEQLKSWYFRITGEVEQPIFLAAGA